jgi:hypothetical protein
MIRLLIILLFSKFSCGKSFSEDSKIVDNLNDTLTVSIEKLASTKAAFTLKIISGSNLANTDYFSMSDPYVKVVFNSVVVGETAIHTDTLSPIFNETFTISTNGTLLEYCTLELFVFDRDYSFTPLLADLDDFLGYIRLQGSELLRHETRIIELKPYGGLRGSDRDRGFLEIATTVNGEVIKK